MNKDPEKHLERLFEALRQVELKALFEMNDAELNSLYELSNEVQAQQPQDARLPDDATRCHDRECCVREYCERYRHRNTLVGIGTHARTLRPGWQVHTEPCDSAIMVPEYQAPSGD